jgi:hypothetical protein
MGKVFYIYKIINLMIITLIINQLFMCKRIESEELKDAYLFVFIGESNSGGYGNNEYLTDAEKRPRPSVQIWHHTLNVFQDLDIETNNLIGHYRLPDNESHGWEHGLACKVEDKILSKPVYLVKCGQGGSRILQWNEGGLFYETMIHRVSGAETTLKNKGINPVFVIWYSQGINDINDNYDKVQWKEATKLLFQRIRKKFGQDVLIIMTEFMSGKTSYNESIEELATDDLFTLSIKTENIYSLRDINHWDAKGMKLMADDLVKMTIEFYGK